jgi:hypothetical protein
MPVATKQADKVKVPAKKPAAKKPAVKKVSTPAKKAVAPKTKAAPAKKPATKAVKVAAPVKKPVAKKAPLSTTLVIEPGRLSIQVAKEPKNLKVSAGRIYEVSYTPAGVDTIEKLHFAFTENNYVGKSLEQRLLKAAKALLSSTLKDAKPAELSIAYTGAVATIIHVYKNV